MTVLSNGAFDWHPDDITPFALHARSALRRWGTQSPRVLGFPTIERFDLLRNDDAELHDPIYCRTRHLRVRTKHADEVAPEGWVGTRIIPEPLPGIADGAGKLIVDPGRPEPRGRKHERLAGRPSLPVPPHGAVSGGYIGSPARAHPPSLPVGAGRKPPLGLVEPVRIHA